MQTLSTILIVLATGFVTWFFSYKKNKSQTKKTEAETVEIAAKIWRDLATDLKKEVVELKTVVDQLKQENIFLKDQVDILILKLKNTK